MTNAAVFAGFSLQSPDESQKIREQVRQRAGLYFPEMKAAEVIVGKRTERAYSKIYEVTIRQSDGKHQPIVVKVSKDMGKQFRAMKEAWPAFENHPTWRIPRPLDFFDDGPAIVMESVAGASLQSLLGRFLWPARAAVEAESYCERAGQWLRFYHGLGRNASTMTIDVDRKLGQFREAWTKLQAAGFNPALGIGLVGILERAAGRLMGISFPVVPIHGDFSVDNIRIDGERVTVLDLWGAHHNLAEHDLASFLNSLLLLRWSRPFPASVYAKLRVAFLGGYDPGSPLNRSAVVFFLGTGLVDVILEVWRRRPGALTRILATRIFKLAEKMLDPQSEGPQP